MPDWQTYEDLLKAHDWTHEMSDDHRVWKRGQAEFERILTMKKELESVDKSQAEALFQKYSDIGWGRNQS